MADAVIFPFAIRDIAICVDGNGELYTSATIDAGGLAAAKLSGAIEVKDALDKHKIDGVLRHVWMGLEPIAAQEIPSEGEAPK